MPWNSTMGASDWEKSWERTGFKDSRKVEQSMHSEKCQGWPETQRKNMLLPYSESIEPSSNMRNQQGHG